MAEENNVLQEDLRFFGQRLATLLALADIPADQKDAWATLVPEMSLEQVERLARFLMHRVPREVRVEAKKLLQDVEKIQADYEALVMKEEQKAEDAIAAIEQEFSEAERVGKLKEDVLSD